MARRRKGRRGGAQSGGSQAEFMTQLRMGLEIVAKVLEATSGIFATAKTQDAAERFRAEISVVPEVKSVIAEASGGMTILFAVLGMEVEVRRNPIEDLTSLWNVLVMFVERIDGLRLTADQHEVMGRACKSLAEYARSGDQAIGAAATVRTVVEAFETDETVRQILLATYTEGEPGTPPPQQPDISILDQAYDMTKSVLLIHARTTFLHDYLRSAH